MKWEYRIVEKRLDEKAIATLGDDGWELVSVVSPGHFILHYFFKRRVEP